MSSSICPFYFCSVLESSGIKTSCNVSYKVGFWIRHESRCIIFNTIMKQRFINLSIMWSAAWRHPWRPDPAVWKQLWFAMCDRQRCEM